MKLRQPIRNKFSIVLFLAMFFLTSTMAQAAEFYAIIANLNGANNPHAQVDVGVDTGAVPGGVPSPVVFNVFRADGTHLAEFVVMTNSNGFASSAFAPAPYDNLFTVSEGQPVLVAVRTVVSASLSGAVLRQTLGKSETVLSLPVARRRDGTGVTFGRVFSTPFGDIPPRATLLIANLSGSDVAVDIFLGTEGAPGGGKYAIPRLVNNASWIIDLDPTDSNSNVILSSTGDVIVQLAVGDSDSKKGISAGLLLPL